MVILGATGDLMTRKIAPALFFLYTQKKLPKLFSIVGVARRELAAAEFQTHLKSILLKHTTGEMESEIDAFIRCATYHKAQFDELEDYNLLATKLGQIDGEWKVCANKLFYLAVPPSSVEVICQNLATSGLTKGCSPEEGWTRILVEKPFGHDLDTAQALDAKLSSLFKEEQIYRIDHYLGKEMLQNILNVRFANAFLEPSWSAEYIESISIRLLETLGVEKRGAFYDGLGTLRDVGQNHLLQMLALITMNRPPAMTTEVIRAERAKALFQLKILTPEEIKSQTVRAQYVGYEKIAGVKTGSNTETYFKIVAQLDNSRWRGVPITLESGKRTGRAIKEIVVTYKSAAGAPKNKVTFQLEPEEEIKIDFASKLPGFQAEVAQRSLGFKYRIKDHSSQYVEEYSKLLLDCIEGNQLLFVNKDEVSAMWRFVDPIVCGWENKVTPMLHYKPDTTPDFSIVAATQELEATRITKKNTIGVIGLGKMGSGLALQLAEKGWSVVGYNRTFEVTQEYAKQGIVPAQTVPELIQKLSTPRVVIISLPATTATDEVLFGKNGLASELESGDIIVDSGNAFYKDTQKRAIECAKSGLEYIDMGTSGGPNGARYGACLMIGGKKEFFEYLKPMLVDLAEPDGFAFFEGVGAGHFAKMVHNGIEYGMMQALAEGFEILHTSDLKYDLQEVARIYNTGSVIESRLVGWLQGAFERWGVNLDEVTSKVAHTGEGAWTIEVAKQMGVPTPIITGSLEFRKQSEANPSFTGKLLSAMRGMFGGHATK